MLMGLHQDIYIIKVSGAGVEHTSPKDRFNFFCQDGFDVISPDFNPLLLEVGMKGITHCFRSDDVACRDINL
jgi:hypothetical protein